MSMLDIISNHDIIDLKVSNEIIKYIKDVTNISEDEKKILLVFLILNHVLMMLLKIYVNILKPHIINKLIILNMIDLYYYLRII